MNDVAIANVQTGNRVSALIPTSIEEAFRVAKAVSMAGMAPRGMDTPEKCLIAIMSGAEVGLAPMQSIQNIAVINNRPCIWGDAVIGVVRASGKSKYIKEWVEGEGDQMVAFCETLRAGETEPVSRSFSVDDARKAGLWQTEARVTRKARNGGNYETDNDSPWFKHPKRMLAMRARSYCLRDTYADVLKGLQIREEVEDYQGPDNAKDVTPARSEMADRYSKPVQKETAETSDAETVPDAENETNLSDQQPDQAEETAHGVEEAEETSLGFDPDQIEKKQRKLLLGFSEKLFASVEGEQHGQTLEEIQQNGTVIKDEFKQAVDEGEMAVAASAIWDAFCLVCKGADSADYQHSRFAKALSE